MEIGKWCFLCCLTEGDSTSRGVSTSQGGVGQHGFGTVKFSPTYVIVTVEGVKFPFVAKGVDRWGSVSTFTFKLLPRASDP